MIAKQTLRNYLCTLTVSISMIEFGYDQGYFSSIQIFDSWTTYFGNPNPGEIGAVNTAYSVVAVVIGFFISPVLSDRYGRRIPVGLAAIAIIIGALVSTFAPRGSIGGFIGGRAIAGLGQGLGMPAGPVYLGEMAPAKTRGRQMSLWQVSYGIGSKIANYVALGCIYSPQLGVWQWRVTVILQLAAPTVLLCTLPFCPETPRWYVVKGRPDDARRSLAKVRLPSEVEPELLEIEAAVIAERGREKGGWKLIFTNRSYFRRFWIAVVMNMAQPFTGITALALYSGYVLNAVFPSTKTVILIKAVEAIPVTLCPFIAFFFADKWGRRRIFIWGTVLQAIVMLTMALVVTQTPEAANGAHGIGVGIGVVILIFVFHLGYGPAWGTSLIIWTTEIFPLIIRARAVAMSTQMQQAAAIALGQAFPSLFKTAGYSSFYLFFGCNVLITIFVWFFIRETKGMSLEHMDPLFGDHDHANVRQVKIESVHTSEVESEKEVKA